MSFVSARKLGSYPGSDLEAVDPQTSTPEWWKVRYPSLAAYIDNGAYLLVSSSRHRPTPCSLTTYLEFDRNYELVIKGVNDK